MRIGATYLGDGTCKFVLWAPFAKRVELRILSADERTISMEQDENGYWKVSVDDIRPGCNYIYKINGALDRADPASFYQPEGVHAPSQVIDHSGFKWSDEKWGGVPLDDMVIYELHVGTFTPEGTFQSVIKRFDELVDLGVNAIEIMPVAQFPGERNWGYDGTYPFAVQNSYGGPQGLKELVNAAHKCGIAVILDVVYNHLGPEGNYLSDFGPYFTPKYKAPWGMAVNYDESYNDHVRNFFIENALYWFREYHIDALRLDAVHGIYDLSAKPFLEELAEEVEKFSKETGRKFYLTAESDLNDARLIRPKEMGGYGIDAQWNDDFHHCIHTLLTGENSGYYVDFGKMEQLVKSLKEGFVYSWDYSPYRKRRHGSSTIDRPAGQFVVFLQNHDQVGNRISGDRLSKLVSFEALKLAAGLVMLSPYIPLIFMGEEYGEEAPFLYFTSHTDPGLINAVREGRKKEFEAFKWEGDIPDPQCETTFTKSKLDWKKREKGKHKVLLDIYCKLIKLRRQIPALSRLDKNDLDILGDEKDRLLFFRRWHNNSNVICIFNLNKSAAAFSGSFPGGKWKKVVDSSDKMWAGPGSSLPELIIKDVKLTVNPFSFTLYELG